MDESERVTRIRPDMSLPRPAWRMPEPRDVTVLGHRMRYWEKGSGRPLVLVHGFSGSASFEWGRVFDALATRFRVIAPQVIGFAPGEQPEIAYTTDALVSHLGGFFAALGLSDIVLLGESFGGWLAGSYAVRAAGLGLPPIAKLVVVGGPIGQMRFPAQNVRGFFHDEVQREADAWMTDAIFNANNGTRMMIVRDSGLTKAELDEAAVETIAVPVLLLWGDKDELIPLEIGERALGWIADARLTVFEDIGHIPSIECPVEFVRVVSSFCEE
jgi:2-hydroxy-6-oxonona-2,4-dienedioate hydrolase